MGHLKFLPSALFVGLALIAMAGCTPTQHVRGNLLEDYQIAEIRVGVDTQSDVLHKLGSPTTKAPFDENTWYYLGQKTEKHGILDPEVAAERIVVATFDADGILSDLRDQDGKRLDIPYVRRKTPTAGSKVTVLQQFLGNLGKFNTSDEEK